MAYRYGGNVHDINTPIPSPPRPQKLDGFDPSACGTYAGYRRHQDHSVPACQDCKDAMAAYSRGRYQPKRPPEKRGFNPDACGTWAGWGRHKYYGVEPCEPCREASREYQRLWRARKAG